MLEYLPLHTFTYIYDQTAGSRRPPAPGPRAEPPQGRRLRLAGGGRRVSVIEVAALSRVSLRELSMIVS